MPAPRKGAAVSPPTGDPQGPGRGASGSETSTCPPGSSPRGRTAVSTPSPEPRPRGSRSPALGAPRVCFGWGPERRTKRAGVRPPRGTLPARQSPRQHRAGRSLARGRPQPRPGKHRGHLPVSLKQTQKMQTTGSDGREAGGGWDGGAGRGGHCRARGHAPGTGVQGAGGTAGPGDTRKVMAVSPVPRALVVPPASTGVNLPDQARQPQAGHARRRSAQPHPNAGRRRVRARPLAVPAPPARPRPTPPSWWQWPAPATPRSCPRTEDARLVTAPQRPAPADGTSQGHRAGPGDSGSRAAPSPPGTPWSLDVPVRDPGQQRCAPASCRPAGPPPGSSGAASAPARQQGPRAREAPRRRAPLPPETPPRREPPAAHGPTGESPRLPRSSSFLRISKQRLWPRVLGARPGWPPFPRGGWGRLPRQPGASPPLPTPAGRPRAPHVLPTHSTGHKAHGPRTDGLRAGCSPASALRGPPHRNPGGLPGGSHAKGPRLCAGCTP